jgi:23S rRNA pseudouridine1911/1915/1917 synthase
MIGRGRDLSAPRDRMELRVKAHSPVRLDLYLREALVWKSRKRIQDLIRGGRILVNGRAAKPSQAVRGGDTVTVQLSMGTGLPEDLGRREVSVIYEDRWIVAVDKPPGLLVHPVGRHVYDTLMNYLHFRYRPEEALAAPPESHPGDDRHSRRVEEAVSLRLCHRIDKETTGIVLVAKDSYVHARIARQFQDREVSKEYLALAAGDPGFDERDVDLPIGEGGNLAEALAPPLKPACTRIQVLRRLPDLAGGVTLVAARPVTGRQNQIRVHLAAIGHPIVGDTRYGGPTAAPPDGFPARYLLHARRLRFLHPRLKTWMELEAPPPPDFPVEMGTGSAGG